MTRRCSRRTRVLGVFGRHICAALGRRWAFPVATNIVLVGLSVRAVVPKPERVGTCEAIFLSYVRLDGVTDDGSPGSPFSCGESFQFFQLSGGQIDKDADHLEVLTDSMGGLTRSISDWRLVVWRYFLGGSHLLWEFRRKFSTILSFRGTGVAE